MSSRGVQRLEVNIGPDIKDITGALAELVRESGIKNGCLHANVVGSTGSLTTIEYEPGVVEDLKQAINRLAPRDAYYAHEEAWHDGNGHSHVKASILKPSLEVPFMDSELMLGTWQQIVFVEFDNKPRKRKLVVQVKGQ